LGLSPLKICDIASYINSGKYKVCCWAWAPRALASQLRTKKGMLLGLGPKSACIATTYQERYVVGLGPQER
jgi:hypothetical protein